MALLGTTTSSKIWNDKTKGALTGAGIGLVGGTLYAFFGETKYLPAMAIGAAAGGLISIIFIIKK
jgi:hypothetical protein